MKTIIRVGTKNVSKEVSRIKELLTFDKPKELTYVAAILWTQGKKRYR